MSWLFLPATTKGINHNLMKQLNEEYNNFNNNIAKIDFRFIKLKDEENIDEEKYSRLLPPYNLPCVYKNKDGCLKYAAFKTNDNQCYCWFHINKINFN